VDARTAEAHRIAQDVAIDALQSLVDLVSRDEWAVTYFNPSLFERDGVPALGWAAFPVSPQVTHQVPLEIEDDRIVARVDGSHGGGGDMEIALRIEDRSDVGDLYNFSAGGPPSLHVGRVRDDEVRIEGETFGASLLAQKGPDDDFVTFSIAIDNRAPDHRLRVLLDLPENADSSVAASPFELVERPPRGEGGTSEPPSPDWPARGMVLAGGSGFLGRGVFEYELVDDRCLAMTLLRCTSTISRPELPNRSVTAGPDVPTPGAQLIGHHAFGFGVLLGGSAPAAQRSWERFALPLAGLGDGSNAGSLPASGSLLEMDVPALSAIRRRGSELEVRIWNPESQARPCSIAGRPFSLGGHAIETITLPRE
jgi:hypothetical protein